MLYIKCYDVTAMSAIASPVIVINLRITLYNVTILFTSYCYQTPGYAVLCYNTFHQLLLSTCGLRCIMLQYFSPVIVIKLRVTLYYVTIHFTSYCYQPPGYAVLCYNTFHQLLLSTSGLRCIMLQNFSPVIVINLRVTLQCYNTFHQLLLSTSGLRCIMLQYIQRQCPPLPQR